MNELLFLEFAQYRVETFYSLADKERAESKMLGLEGQSRKHNKYIKAINNTDYAISSLEY